MRVREVEIKREVGIKRAVEIKREVEIKKLRRKQWMVLKESQFNLKRI